MTLAEWCYGMTRCFPFEPQLIGKHEGRFTGFDDKVIALSARDLTVREIQADLWSMARSAGLPSPVSCELPGVAAGIPA